MFIEEAGFIQLDLQVLLDPGDGKLLLVVPPEVVPPEASEIDLDELVPILKKVAGAEE
jgi:hypothetical protein